MPKKIQDENPVSKAVRLCGGSARVAELANVDRTTVWRWQTTGRIPDFECALAIAKELKCSVDKLASPASRVRKSELKHDLL